MAHIKEARSTNYGESYNEIYRGEIHLVPCANFETFRHVNDGKKKFTNIPVLKCDYCGSDLSESGNGSYYSGYIVFESHNHEEPKIACSRNCQPENCMDFDDQIYGYRNPIILPSKFKNDLKYLAVFCAFVRKFEFNKYFDKKITVEELKEHSNSCFGSFGGKVGYDMNKGIFCYGKSIDEVYKKKNKLSLSQICEIINEIISMNEKPKFRVHTRGRAIEICQEYARIMSVNLYKEYVDRLKKGCSIMTEREIFSKSLTYISDNIWKEYEEEYPAKMRWSTIDMWHWEKFNKPVDRIIVEMIAPLNKEAKKILKEFQKEEYRPTEEEDEDEIA